MRTKGVPNSSGGNTAYDTIGYSYSLSGSLVTNLGGREVEPGYLAPGKSTKQVEVLAKGSLVQREFHIYTDTTFNGTNFELAYRLYFTND